MADKTSVHVIISGRVQGVGYRAWCVRTAMALGLSGWARNRRSGNVEVVLCGEPSGVEAMLDALWKGPVHARVDKVEVVGEAPPEEGAFDVKPTL